MDFKTHQKKQLNRTVLTQQSISEASSAEQVFSRKSDTTPLVLVPDDRCCLSCCLSVPSGPFSIMHKWGRNYQTHLAQPGLQCMCSYYRVAYCVRRTAVSYDAPVKSCPTSDNVRVDCDLQLLFRIGPEPQKVKNFVYKLGAHRFDDFLRAATEEAVRHLIRKHNHHQVYDLKGERSGPINDTLRELNKKFDPFGVHIQRLIITDVQFEKEELMATLANTTKVKAQIEEVEKKHEVKIDAIEHDRAHKLKELSERNQRTIQNLVAEKKKLIEVRRDMIMRAQGSQAKRLVDAERQAAIDLRRAKATLTAAKNAGLTEQEREVGAAERGDKSSRITFQRECDLKVYESEQRRLAAVAKSQALIAEARAEEKAAGDLSEFRSHELKMGLIEVMENIASKSTVTISGESGERLLSTLMSNDVLNVSSSVE